MIGALATSLWYTCNALATRLRLYGTWVALSTSLWYTGRSINLSIVHMRHSSPWPASLWYEQAIAASLWYTCDALAAGLQLSMQNLFGSAWVSMSASQ